MHTGTFSWLTANHIHQYFFYSFLIKRRVTSVSKEQSEYFTRSFTHVFSETPLTILMHDIWSGAQVVKPNRLKEVNQMSEARDIPV
jgi:hypothetical protein